MSYSLNIPDMWHMEDSAGQTDRVEGGTQTFKDA